MDGEKRLKVVGRAGRGERAYQTTGCGRQAQVVDGGRKLWLEGRVMSTGPRKKKLRLFGIHVRSQRDDIRR